MTRAAAILCGLCGVLATALFTAIYWTTAHFGVIVSRWNLFCWWYVVGVACASYWPLRWLRNMKGRWLGHLPEIAVLGLFGPLAIVVNYPL